MQLRCNWCGQFFDHIFQGDEVVLLDHAFFVCKTCGDLIEKLNFRKKEEDEG